MCPDGYSDIQAREPANEFEPARLRRITLQLAGPGRGAQLSNGFEPAPGDSE